MKNVKDLQKEIDEITANKKRKEKEVGYLKPGVIKKMRARKDYLATCIAYLNTNPTQEFIQKEKERLMKRNNLIMEDLPKEQKFTNKDGKLNLKAHKKAKRDYEKLMGLPHIRLQLRTLQFIS